MHGMARSGFVSLIKYCIFSKVHSQIYYQKDLFVFS